MNRTKFAHESPPRANPRRATHNPNSGIPCAASLARYAHLPPLQDNTLVARAPRYPLTIEVLEERDSIFARDTGQLLENGDGDALAFGFLEDGKAVAELRKSVAVKNQLGRDADQALVAQ